MKKILVIGGSGLLGNQLILDLHKSNRVSATYFKNTIEKYPNVRKFKLDILDNTQVSKILRVDRWDLVLHCASAGDVDFCQKHKKQAWRINVIGTKNIATTCKRHRLRLVFFSTNAVYLGKGPYKEIDSTEPINYYGYTKLIAEREITKIPKSLILRLNTMYGWPPPGQRHNPATWIIESLEKNKKIGVVDDIYNNHLWSGFVSRIIKKLLINVPSSRLINIGGKDCISRYDFALKVAEVFKLNPKLIKKSKSSDYTYLAPRPANTCFVVNRIIKEIGIKPLSITEGLNLMSKSR